MRHHAGPHLGHTHIRPPLRLVALSVIASLLVCCQAQPEAEAEPKSKPGPRVVKREAAKDVVIDEAFLKPYFKRDNTTPALSKAYDAFIEGETHKARKELEAFLGHHKKHHYRGQALFMLALIEDRAGNDKEAVALYEEAETTYPILAEQSRYFGARAAYAAGMWEKTVELCKKISMGSQFGPRSKYLRGVAMLRLGQSREAVAVLEEWVGAYPRSSLYSEVALDLAYAYESAGRMEDAAKMFQELRFRFPGGSIEKDANSGVERVKKRVGKKKARKLFTPTRRDRIHRAQALHKKHRSDDVIKEVGQLLKDKGLKAGSADGCDARWLMAAAYTKLRKHKEAASHYQTFTKNCPSDKRVLKALYTAGKGLWTVDQDEKALTQFETIWKNHPNHSYADDAVLYAARIHRSNNNLKDYRKMLELQVKRFPGGDMLGDAYWHLFLTDYQAGRYQEAITFVDSLRGKTAEKDIYTRGRLAYFQARAYEKLGKNKEAKAGYEAVARNVPMSYYALLAINRLDVLDTAAAKLLVAELSKEQPAPKAWKVRPPHLAQDSRFQRGVELLRLGLFDLADDEFQALRRKYPKKDDVLWVLTVLFDQAGAYHLSHNIPRRHIGKFGKTYPSGPAKLQYELAYPQPFKKDVAKWAEERKIPLGLIYAIMREESGFNPKIESWANACGLMQLMVPTANHLAKKDGLKKTFTCPKLFVPADNIRLGSRFLKDLMDDYDQHPSVAIAGYNGGNGNVDRWIKENGKLDFDLWVEEIPFGQTRHYTKRVSTSLWIYTWLHADANPDPKANPLETRLISLPNTVPKPSTAK